MLSVILACDDLYDTAKFMTETLGWRLVFATPADSDDRLACVALADNEVMLGTTDEEFLPATSRDHRGAGVSIYVQLPPEEDIAAVHGAHAAAGVVTVPLSQRPWGVLAFNAVIASYQFLITQELPQRPDGPDS
jgi:catechol 2,3-dioxygenase-like lactoylglutathione lyase family enzyme